MRLHEYLRSMDDLQRLRFRQWQILNNKQIYKIKRATVTEKRNTAQQHLFETKLVELHKESQ